MIFFFLKVFLNFFSLCPIFWAHEEIYVAKEQQKISHISDTVIDFPLIFLAILLQLLH